MQPHIREFVDRAVTFTVCPDCDGTRLTEAARSSKIAGISIADACAMQISDLAEWVRGLDEPSVGPLLENLGQTLDSFVSIGLGYLSLDRPAGTLSGGEAQRLKLESEMEFYQRDPSKAPMHLRRAIAENQDAVAEQQRFIAGQVQEKQRVNQRFDVELLQLRKLWAERDRPALPLSGGAGKL